MPAIPGLTAHAVTIVRHEAAFRNHRRPVPRSRRLHGPAHRAAAVGAAVQLKLATLPRVWVAGFATDKPGFDLNTETVRLVRAHLRTWSSAQVIEAEPLPIDSERRLSDVAYWRALGEEHRHPLIVTGSVKLHIAPARVVQRGIRTAYAYAD